MEFSPEVRQQLFDICRKSAEEAVRTGSIEAYPVPQMPGLEFSAAVFVTIRREGELRGCIGTVEARQILPRAVALAAASAAVSDLRFPPVTLEELVHLSFEISILTDFREIHDTGEIEIGRHGLLVVQGQCRGLLLPQVAREHKLDREQFLEQTCRKAGLPPEAWMSPATSISLFESQILSELL